MTDRTYKDLTALRNKIAEAQRRILNACDPLKKRRDELEERISDLNNTADTLSDDRKKIDEAIRTIHDQQRSAIKAKRLLAEVEESVEQLWEDVPDDPPPA